MRKLRIGYQSLSADLSQPGDRRRVVFWAKNRGHQIVTDLREPCDVILLSERADIGAFSRKFKTVPVIFDLVDAYLARESRAKDWFRGTSKVSTRQLSGLPKPFTKFVENMCIGASAVICSSPEQLATILPFSTNVHVILDSHDELPMLRFGAIGIGAKREILWEGMPATIGGVSQLSSALVQISKMREVEMKFVTDHKYFRLLGKFWEQETLSLIQETMGGASDLASIIPWSIEKLVGQAKISSLAVIPIDLSNPLQYLKPENRLLIMWRLGLPCLTSSSPAYVRVSTAANVDSTCASPNEWLSKMSRILSSPDEAEECVRLGQDYLNNFHNKDLILERWDRAFESVI